MPKFEEGLNGFSAGKPVVCGCRDEPNVEGAADDTAVAPVGCVDSDEPLFDPEVEVGCELKNEAPENDDAMLAISVAVCPPFRVSNALLRLNVPEASGCFAC